MAEDTAGVRSVLSVPSAYSLLQRALGAQRSRERLVREHLRPQAGERVLDLGCGTAEILDALPADVDYVGFDHNPRYVDAAQRRYGARARFAVDDVSATAADGHGGFDLALAMGVLHHLGDDEVVALLGRAARALRPSGRFISSDNVWVDGQSGIARWLIGRDRGANVRTVAQYAELAGRVFQDVHAYVREDLLRVPYTLVILECRRPA